MLEIAADAQYGRRDFSQLVLEQETDYVYRVRAPSLADRSPWALIVGDRVFDGETEEDYQWFITACDGESLPASSIMVEGLPDHAVWCYQRTLHLTDEADDFASSRGRNENLALAKRKSLQEVQRPTTEPTGASSPLAMKTSKLLCDACNQARPFAYGRASATCEF